jgi:hypothetical protein
MGNNLKIQPAASGCRRLRRDERTNDKVDGGPQHYTGRRRHRNDNEKKRPTMGNNLKIQPAASGCRRLRRDERTNDKVDGGPQHCTGRRRHRNDDEKKRPTTGNNPKNILQTFIASNKDQKAKTMASAKAVGKYHGVSSHVAMHARSPSFKKTSARRRAGVSALSYEKPLSWPPLLSAPALCRQKSICLFEPRKPQSRRS